MKKDWLAPLTGVAFIVLVIIGFIVGGEPPDVDEPVQEIVDHYVDDKDSIEVGVFILGLGVVLFIFFANHLRVLFRETATSATILVGAAIFAIAGGIDGMITVALAETADDIEPQSVQALQALWDNDFVPFAIGITVFTFSLGLSILKTPGVLPRWLGWVTVVIAVISVLGPIGFFAFPLTGLLILVVSVMLAVRARGAGTPPPSAAPPAPEAPPPPV